MTNSPYAVLEYRKALYRAGYPPLPVLTQTKRAAHKGWQHLSQQNPPPCVNETSPATELSTGVYCGSQIIAVDVDVNDVTKAQDVRKVLIEILGAVPIRSRSDSGRFLMAFRNGSPERKYKSISAGDGLTVDFLTGNRYFVADGIHPEGVPYSWTPKLQDWHVSSLREVTAEQIEAFRDEAARLLGAQIVSSSPDDFEEKPAIVVDALPIPNETEKRIAESVLRKLCEDLAATTKGGRNNALNNAALQMEELIAGWGIDREIVETTLWEAATYCGLVTDDAKEAKDTLDSGLRTGLSQPRARKHELPVLDFSNVTVKGKPLSGVGATSVSRRSLALTSMTEIEETPIRWLWNGYLPAGMLTLLSGAGGTGKSTLAFSLAATVTTGGLWPDGTRCGQAGNVLIFSSEDDLAATIKPRLMLAGADISKVHAIQGIVGENGERLPFNPAADIPMLYDAIRQIGKVSLIIIDPIVSAVGGDMHKANDVRRSLQPIVDIAEELGSAVIGITHFSKGSQGKNPTERVIGSQAFSALARMVWVAAKEEDSERRVFTRSKSNISVDTGGFAYEIKPYSMERGIIATRVEWGEQLDGTSRDILAGVEVEGPASPINMTQEAMRFLHEELKDGPVPSRDLTAKAKKDFGLTERTLQRAGKKLGIVVTKAGYHGGWVWSYPFSLSSE